MKWKREKPGVYTAGPYLVEEVESLPTTPRQSTMGSQWHASGPDVDSNWLRKSEAQAACAEKAKQRIGTGTLVEPVVDDVAEYAGKRAVISALMSTNDGTPLYCLRLARGKRQCLLRHEFTVVLP